MQKERSENGVPLVLMTHEASAQAVRDAIADMLRADFLLAPAVCYRVMG